MSTDTEKYIKEIHSHWVPIIDRPIKSPTYERHFQWERRQGTHGVTIFVNGVGPHLAMVSQKGAFVGGFIVQRPNKLIFVGYYDTVEEAKAALIAKLCEQYDFS